MTRYLIDAQLPSRLAPVLQAAGYDALHTLDLPKGNATEDTEINRVSLEERRVVVTKDADFVQSFSLRGQPYKLLLVSTGNIRNEELITLFEQRLPQLDALFTEGDFVELTREFLILHS